ncbi:MAG: hypothetical protein IJ852_03450 [Alphaproteobacteria bacterium]|nr:hypothetical protein [Alphaproteobacteria bacterium]
MMDHQFCAKFRKELASKGIASIVTELIVSKSEKVPLKKQYLARECAKKKAFKAQVSNACKQVLPAVSAQDRIKIIELHRELTGEAYL